MRHQRILKIRHLLKPRVPYFFLSGDSRDAAIKALFKTILLASGSKNEIQLFS